MLHSRAGNGAAFFLEHRAKFLPLIHGKPGQVTLKNKKISPLMTQMTLIGFGNLDKLASGAIEKPNGSFLPMTR